MSQFKSVDTHGASPPIQVPADELEAATVELCAQIAEAAESNSQKADNPYDGGSGSLGYEAACDDIASAIRSLIPNSAGALEAPHRGVPAGESDPAVTQDCAPAGTVSKADICATLCKAHGTAQCAAICMSHSSLHTTDGCCPEAKRVWVHKARALLSQFDVRRK